MRKSKSSSRFSLGSDINLDKEILRDKKGQRITEARARKLAEDVFKNIGRPSLSASRIHSPQVRVRVPQKLRKKLDREARRRGVTPSIVVREALERFLRSA